MGHVNNAVYSTYLEEARIGVLGDLIDFILARVEIDFRSELRMGEDVEVRTRCSRIGTKSFDLEHVIAADGRVVAEAKSVLVSYDYERGESVPVPDELRERRRAARDLRLGSGVVDVEECVRTLARIGYEGALAVEHEPESYDPSEEVRAMRKQLEEWLR